MYETLQPPEGMNQLKRLFGDLNVSEELCASQAYGSGRRPVNSIWSYAVTIDADHSLLPHRPDNEFELGNLLLPIERTLCDQLDLHQCLEHYRNDDSEDILRQSSLPARRLVIPVVEAESQSGVNALRQINRDDLTFRTPEWLITSIERSLRRASHGIRWAFEHGSDCNYFRSITRLVRNPGELEIGVLSLLRLSIDDYLLPPVKDFARISLAAVMNGDLGSLMESWLPKPISKIREP